MNFDRPTLVTLTAPTASGKSFLLNELTNRGIFDRIVSTTTRPPRKGEQQGVDYDFVSLQTSIDLEKIGGFFELIEFNGVRYGVTHIEMQGKMNGTQAPAVVLEPQGLKIYEEKCREHGWDIFKIYVHVEEGMRIQRLHQRVLSQVWETIDSIPGPIGGSYDRALFDIGVEGAKGMAAKAIGEYHRRMLGLAEERRWQQVTEWDAIVPGDNVEKAISMIEQGIKWRNRRRAEPQAIGKVDLPLA